MDNLRQKRRFFFSIFMFVIFLFSSCSQLNQTSPTPDMDALATQLWVEISVKNTLEASQATATPLPSPSPTPTATPLWKSTPMPIPQDPTDNTPVVNPVSGIEILFVPAGEFLMGSAESDSNRDSGSEEPQHEITLDAYWISKLQVTNASFNACVTAGVCGYDVAHGTNPKYLDPLFANHPVVYTTWQMAQTYCEWTGGRLPTEAEWEKAARGPNAQRFPWGSDLARLRFANANNEIGNTTPVGNFPYGESYYGALDMGGNVREWVSDWYDAEYFYYSPQINPQGPETGEKKVLKGASFQDPWIYCRSANRLEHEPDSPGTVRGFRCVYP